MALCLLALTATVVMAQSANQKPISVMVDGNPIHFTDQQPRKSNDRVLVPLRGIFEALGASVEWDPEHQSIRARRGEQTVELTIGQLDASINGSPVHLDVPALLVGGSTMVPLRFVSEALGANVTWNDFDQEADISSTSPNRTSEESRRGNQLPNQGRREPIRKSPPPVARYIISEDSVIPLSLNNRLSSRDARAGDPFSATLITEGQPRYMGLPAGTQAYGHVSYSKQKYGEDPGTLELTFERLTTPGGLTLPLNGRLIGLDDKNIIRHKDGSIIAKSSTRNDRVVYTGAGAGVGLIVGLLSKRPIEDAAIGGLLGNLLGSVQHRTETNDVNLNPGVHFGIRLHASISFPRGVH